MINTDLIQGKLNLSSANLKLISDNIANINTPNYKRKYIDAQNSDLNSTGAAFCVELKKASEKHLDGTNTCDADLKEVQAFIRTDGNGVDTTTEIMEMNKNSLFNNSLIKLLNKDLTNAKTVINSK